MGFKTPDLKVIEKDTTLTPIIEKNTATISVVDFLSDTSNNRYFQLSLSKTSDKNGKISCMFPSGTYPETDFSVSSIKFNLAWKVSGNITELDEEIDISIDMIGDKTHSLPNVAKYSITPKKFTNASDWHSFQISITDPKTLKDFAENSVIRSGYFSINISAEATGITTLGSQYFHIDGSGDSTVPTAQIEIYPKSDIYRYSNKWQRLLQAYRYNGSSWEAVSGWPYDGSGDTAKLLKPREHYYTYSITYDYNGGINSGQSTSTHIYTSTQASFEQTLHNIEPARSGYYFLGWNTAADGTGTAYVKQASISINSNIKLYAVWMKMYNLFYKKSRKFGDLSGLAADWISAVGGNSVFRTGPVTNGNDVSKAYYGLQFTYSSSIQNLATVYNYSLTKSQHDTRSFPDDPINTELAWTSIQLPENTAITIYLKARYYPTRWPYSEFPKNCDIYDKIDGSNNCNGKEVNATFTLTQNLYIHGEWRAEGAPAAVSLIDGSPLGSSFWNAYVTR